MTWYQHIQSACARAGELATSTLWLVVGEWSPAAHDCAKSLNGRGLGSRYDGTFPGSSRVGSCVGLTGSGPTGLAYFMAGSRGTRLTLCIVIFVVSVSLLWTSYFGLIIFGFFGT